MKQIALGLAAAFLSATGVGSATMAFSQSTDHQSAALSVSNDHVAASFSADPNVKVSDVTDMLGSLPGVADVVSKIPGASQVDSLVDSLPSVADIKNKVTSVIPSACGAGLPSLPLPTGTINTVTGAVSGVAATAKSLVPVNLPVQTPDVLGAAGHELGCLTSKSASPVPSICNIAAGLPIPSAVSSAIPAPVNGVVGTVLSDFGNVTGQAVSAGAGNSIGVNCKTSDLPDVMGTVNGAVGTVKGLAGNLPLPVPVPGVASVKGTANSAINTATGAVGSTTNALTNTATGAVSTVTGLAGKLPLPAAGVGDLTGTVNGVVDTVTSTVNSLIPGLPGLSCSTSGSASGTASSGGILGGLLGSLTASISGSC